MSRPEDDLVEIVLRRIFDALTPADLRNFADILDRDPAGFALGLSGAVRGMLDDANGPKPTPSDAD